MIIAAIFTMCDDPQSGQLAPVTVYPPQVVQDTLVLVSWSISHSDNFSHYTLAWDTVETLIDFTDRSIVFDDRDILSDTLSNLEWGKTSYLKVFVEESDGDSVGSNVVSVFLEEPPAPPVQVLPPGDPGYTFASLSWTSVKDQGFEYYECWLDTTPSFESETLRTDTFTAPEDSTIIYHDLLPGQQFYFQVWLHLADSLSVGSGIIEFSTLSAETDPPIFITSVEQIDVNAGLVTWSRYLEHNFLAYEIFLAEDDSLAESFFRVASHENPADTGYVFQDLQIDRQYYTKVVLHLEEGDRVISALVPFRLEGRFENHIGVTDVNGWMETDLAGYFIKIQAKESDGNPIPDVSINVTRSGEYLIMISNLGNTQPRYRALVLNELEGEQISGSGTSLDPLVIFWDLDLITAGYETYQSNDHNQLGSFFYQPDILVQQSTGNLFDIYALLAERMDQIGPIIQLSRETAENLSTDPKYLSLSPDIFLQGVDWFEVVIGDALGLYANDEIVFNWGESATGRQITPLYLGDVELSHNFIYKFTLTWGQHPRDLDSYLWTPEIDGVSYMVYYGDRGSETQAPFAELDLDDVDRWGPESITLNQLFPGIYRYSIHHYAEWEDDSLDISHSQAEVRMADPNGVVQVFNVPETDSQDWWYWHVLEIDGTTGEVTVLNELSPDAPSSTTLRDRVPKH